ncbi:hypothetical protein, partial [Brevundimonas sp.]|uniref:hypothetical protein n=1 Tax=Brevundimonas sp. TaxID=1871086 RepID=UPI0025B813BC
MRLIDAEFPRWFNSNEKSGSRPYTAEPSCAGPEVGIALCLDEENGAPGTIRTSDPQIRSLM